jgi:hypothetical protein
MLVCTFQDLTNLTMSEYNTWDAKVAQITFIGAWNQGLDFDYQIIISSRVLIREMRW